MREERTAAEGSGGSWRTTKDEWSEGWGRGVFLRTMGYGETYVVVVINGRGCVHGGCAFAGRTDDDDDDEDDDHMSLRRRLIDVRRRAGNGCK